MRLQTSAGGEDWNRSAPLSTTPATKGDASAMTSSDDLSEAQRDLWNRVRARLKASVGGPQNRMTMSIDHRQPSGRLPP